MADLDIQKNPKYQIQGVPDSIKMSQMQNQLHKLALIFITTEHVQRRTDSIKMSQLQNLLHDALIATEHVQQCAIVRRKDCLVRAASVGFNLYQDQVQMLLDAFKNPPQTREEGIYFDDRQFKCVRADKNSIYAKCGKRGLVLVKTLSLLLVATYTESMFPSVCVEAVEKLADYFKEKGK